MAALIFGAIAVGMLAEWAARRGVAMLDLAALGVALFMLVQLGMVINHKPSLQLLAVLFTLVGTVAGLEYTIVAQSMPPALTGRAATCLNLMIFLGAFLVQAGVGEVLAWWTPDRDHHYPALAYRVAFLLLVLLQLPGLLLFILRRRPVEWALRFASTKEEHETGPLRPPRQGKARPVR